MSIKDYINNTSAEEREDFEAHIFENVFAEFAEALPKDPPEPIAVDLWTDGVEILCRTEALAEQIANAVDRIAGEQCAHTGYYDPFEDARNGETDDHTGWYYVDYD